MSTYKQDNMTIHNADCMEIMAGYEDDYFDLAVVDPPYGIGADKSHKKRASKEWKGKSGGQWKEYKDTSWDNNIPDESYFIELMRVSKHQIIWGGNYYPIFLKGVIIWDKGENGTLPHGEMAKTSIKTFKSFKMSRADAYINNPSEKIHPTQKPVKLYNWIYANYAEEGQKILDTHLGSGSNAIAAHYAKMHFVGCELDEDYYKASIERIRKETRQMELF